MPITTNLPAIPKTPEPPNNTPHELPAFLGSGSLKKLITEFARTRELYNRRAKMHQDVANPRALNEAVAADDLAHAKAVREGKDDPGPVSVERWKANEEEARRAVAGARDALRLVWVDILYQLADPDIGGALLEALDQRREKTRTKFLTALDTVRACMADLDVADDEAKYVRKSAEYAKAWVANPTAPQRPDGQAARYPTTLPTGNAQPLVVQGRPEPVPNVLQQIAAYRKGER